MWTKEDATSYCTVPLEKMRNKNFFNTNGRVLTALPLRFSAHSFLQLAAVIRAPFTLFPLNLQELVGSYPHDFIWPQCLFLWLNKS